MSNFDIRKWAANTTAAIEEQQAALGAKVEEGRVAEMIDANLEPIRAEMEALGKQRMTRQGAGNLTQRDAALIGTKYEHIRDPLTGRKFSANDVEFMHDALIAWGISPSEKLRNLHAEISTRAMDTAESGFGAELVGVEYVSDLWQAARESSVVFSQLASWEIPQGAASAYVPVVAAPPEVLYVAENTAADASDYGTSKVGSNRVLVSPKKFIIHLMFSGEMEEDSMIPLVPFYRTQAAWSLAYYSDSAVINGDTTNAGTGNINLDDADPADTKHYLAFNGMRKVGLVDNTANEDNVAAAIDYNDLVRLRSKMLDRTYLQDWGHPINPMDLIYVAGPELADEIALLDETITVDKYGSAAMVVAGEVTKIGRNPLVSTIAMPNTELDGKVSTTAANNTKGQVLLFNRLGFAVGWKRRVKFERERLPRRDQDSLVWTLRMGLGRYTPTGNVANIEAAAVARNITVPTLA